MSLFYVNYFDLVQVTCEKQHKLYIKCKTGKFLANEIFSVIFFLILYLWYANIAKSNIQMWILDDCAVIDIQHVNILLIHIFLKGGQNCLIPNLFFIIQWYMTIYFYQFFFFISESLAVSSLMCTLNSFSTSLK